MKNNLKSKVLQDPSHNHSPLREAIEYHRLGWSIIPVSSGTKLPLKSFRWKPYQKTLPTENQLRRWFSKNNGYGLAVILGSVSGNLVCRDFDVMDAYNAWASEHSELANSLPTVATARGRHVYFRAKYYQINHLGDGELRGSGYCLLPPSIHPHGMVYEWLIPVANVDIPFIADLREAGFTKIVDVTERTEITETTEIADDNRREQKQLKGMDIESAIMDSLPKEIGNRNRQVFELARTLKAVPSLANAPTKSLKTYVRTWHQLGVEKNVIGTVPFEETWIDFCISWPKVKYPKGSEPMTEIYELAKQAPLPQAAMQYEQEGLRLLVALCRELQRVSVDKPFFLACRTAGELLDVTHITAWRWLFTLIEDGILEEVQKGKHALHRASRYRYLAD